jgi:hypothetical protein
MFLGLLIGYVLSVFQLFLYFFWNLWPFGESWGEKDGLIIMVELWNNLVELPFFFLDTLFVGIFSTPLLLYPFLGLMTVLFLGILWPSGHNRGSLSSSNAEYAAISLSSLFLLIGLIAMLSFGGVLSSVAESQYQHFEDSNELDSPYFFIDPLEHPDLNLEEQAQAKTFQYSSDVTLLECNSLNSLYDFSDTFVYSSSLQPQLNYHVMIKSSHSLWLYSDNHYLGERPVDDVNFVVNDFTTSQLYLGSEEFRLQIPGFDADAPIGIPDEMPEFTLIKYHVAYIPYSEDSELNSSEMLHSALADVDFPSSCDSYSLSGTLESRVRATSLGFLFSGTFLMGCCIHRFYIVSGHHGTTDQRILTRAFLLSQGISVTFIGILLLLFDPLNGSGVTGISTDQLIAAGILAAKLLGIAVGVLLASIFVIVLYRQREFIGQLIEIERTRAVIDDWFDD